MTLQDVLAPLVWALNGLLVILYSLVERWQTVLLIPPLVLLAVRGPREHRSWAYGIALLCLPVSLFAPPPLPALLLVMGLAAVIATTLETFNPAGLHWRALSGLALYALLGAGITLFQGYLETGASASPLLAQGQGYIGVLAAISLYGVPLGYLALLAQRLLVHPPIPGSARPDELVHALRARKQD